MTITLSPEQEQAVRDAIRTGRLASIERWIRRTPCETVNTIPTWAESTQLTY
jgi:hypothetical protein